MKTRARPAWHKTKPWRSTHARLYRILDYLQPYDTYLCTDKLYVTPPFCHRIAWMYNNRAVHVVRALKCHGGLLFVRVE